MYDYAIEQNFMHDAPDRIKLYYTKQLEYDKGIYERI